MTLFSEQRKTAAIEIGKKILPALFYILLVVFLLIYLKNIEFSKFKEAHFVWGYIVVASMFGIMTRYWQIFIWFVLLSGLGAKDLIKSTGQLIYVYAKSWLGRYIPGTAPWILGKIYFASKHGIDKNKLAVSSLLEGALQVAVVMAMAFLMLIFDSRLNVISDRLKLGMIAILIVCIISILPPIFNRLVSIAYKIIRKKPLEREHLASGATIAKGASLYAIGSIFNGLSLFFVAKAVSPTLSYHDLLFVMGTGNLAGAVGMLAIFVPSGIGVREGVQLILLNVIMPKEIALLVTISTRLWGVIMDFIFFGLSKVIQQTFKS